MNTRKTNFIICYLPREGQGQTCYLDNDADEKSLARWGVSGNLGGGSAHTFTSKAEAFEARDRCLANLEKNGHTNTVLQVWEDWVMLSEFKVGRVSFEKIKDKKEYMKHCHNFRHILLDGEVIGNFEFNQFTQPDAEVRGDVITFTNTENVPQEVVEALDGKVVGFWGRTKKVLLAALSPDQLYSDHEGLVYGEKIEHNLNHHTALGVTSSPSALYDEQHLG